MRVGFIGLGRMGQAMASRVLAGGHELSVFNRSAGKSVALAQAGARVATSIAAACEAREVVISMLADDAALAEVALGAGGLRDAMPKASIHLAMGTHGVAAIRALTEAHAEAGQFLVAAPVLGRPDAAAAGQLGIVASGDSAAVARCEPLFNCIGRRTFLAGEIPAGATAIKLANNFLVGSAIEAMGEAYSLVRKYGVAPQVLFEVMTEGLFSAPAYKVYGKIIAEEAYDNVGFTVTLALKDFELMLAAAGAEKVPLAIAQIVRDRLIKAQAGGEGERDWAIMARGQARAAGLD